MLVMVWVTVYVLILVKTGCDEFGNGLGNHVSCDVGNDCVNMLNSNYGAKLVIFLMIILLRKTGNFDYYEKIRDQVFFFGIFIMNGPKVIPVGFQRIQA